MEVPLIIIQRVANRWGRLRRLRELGAPPVITENEEEILGDALDRLRAFAIEHGAVPSDADVEAMRESDMARERAIKPFVDHILGGEEHDVSVRDMVVQSLVQKNIDSPTPAEVRAAWAEVRQMMAGWDDEP